MKAGADCKWNLTVQRFGHATRCLSDLADTMPRYVVGGPIADGDTAPEQQ